MEIVFARYGLRFFSSRMQFILPVYSKKHNKFLCSEQRVAAYARVARSFARHLPFKGGAELYYILVGTYFGALHSERYEKRDVPSFAKTSVFVLRRSENRLDNVEAH